MRLPDRLRVEVFQSLRGVKRQDLPREVMAGITLAALMVPLNIGYAQVAGLPPIVGLYTSIGPMIAFAIFSSSRELVAGPDSPIAALIGSLLATMAATNDPEYVQLAYAQALVCALIFFGVWLFRLGFLANFLSGAVMIGFVSGLGIEVFTSQMKKIMGVEIDVDGWFREVFELFKSIPDASIYAVFMGVGTIVIIRLTKRYIPRVPGALLALIVMTAAVELFSLEDSGLNLI